MNIATLLEMAADTLPDRAALGHGDGALSFADLAARARAAAAEFAALPGEFVAFLDTNGPAAPIALFGAAIAGKIYVPLNYRLSEPELQALLQRTSPCVLIGGQAYLAKLPPVTGVLPVTTDSFLQACAQGGGGDMLPPDAEDAIAVQLFTSGTTGQPKAALLKHANLSSYIFGTVEFAACEAEETAIVAVPPYHIAGISAALSACYGGRRSVFLPNFTPQGWIALAVQSRATHAFLVPTMLARIIDYIEQASPPPDLSALRAIAYGGGKMPPGVIARALPLLPGVDFTNAYGLTETSSTIALLGPEDHRAAAASADPMIQRRMNSVGRALPSVEIEIRSEDGAVLGPEQAGLVFVRGDQVAGTYREQGDLKSGDGWFSTRDRGFLDQDGYLFLDGRADDVIVRGGENISPGEIEDILNAHPDVAESAVVAIADAEWGEAVGAVLVLRASAAAGLAAELQGRVRAALRSSRVPQEIRHAPELPYNETGKLLRRVIRDRFGSYDALP